VRHTAQEVTDEARHWAHRISGDNVEQRNLGGTFTLSPTEEAHAVGHTVALDIPSN
jgi:hypothetical protein